VACRIVRPLAAAIQQAGGPPGQREVDLFADDTCFRQARELVGGGG
jgi:hypothetical protein